jgi:hypothetical protein
VGLDEIEFAEELIASIFKVERISELGRTLAVTSKPIFAEPGITIPTQRHIPQQGRLLSHRRENLESYIALTGWDL